MPLFDDDPTTPQLPAGVPCRYLLSAGDATDLWEAANASAKDAGDPGVVLRQLEVDGVTIDIDPETNRAMVAAVVGGALREFADRQYDATGTILGTWREA